ncbi:MAG: LysM peptidoglycan-binding domain-containing protein [Anaerolineales bacterium]|nr:LysM peptidoglycan-binding domain-containing protein [Anaerolineales bacterium]
MRVALKISVLLIVLALVVPLVITPSQSAQAQVGTNLLINPNFNAQLVPWYVKPGISGQVPGGWDVWGTGFESNYNQFQDFARSQPGSWQLKGGSYGGSGAWTGGGLQQVNVTQGKVYRFQIYAFTFTCNNLATSCRDENGQPKSDTSAGSTVKVGFDPTGGTDANAATVYWTSPTAMYDPPLKAISIDAYAEGARMTVFFYTSVAAAPQLRETYWDDASLAELAEGEGAPPNSGGGTGTGDSGTTAPPPDTVPFVTPQQAQPDGSVVHTVVEGDTFDSIYVAYRFLGVTREYLYELNGWEDAPRWILIGEKIKILPPGSVDPVTGQLLRPVGGGTVPSTPVATTTAPITPPVSTNPSTNPEGDGGATSGGGNFDVVKGG